MVCLILLEPDLVLPHPIIPTQSFTTRRQRAAFGSAHPDQHHMEQEVEGSVWASLFEGSDTAKGERGRGQMQQVPDRVWVWGSWQTSARVPVGIQGGQFTTA